LRELEKSKDMESRVKQKKLESIQKIIEEHQNEIDHNNKYVKMRDDDKDKKEYKYKDMN
jgi:hypothetical protein